MQAIQGNKDAISSLSNTLNCDINAVQTALNTINTSVSQIACDTKLASCEVINAITSGNANLASQLANCCCQTQRSIDSVNLNLTQMMRLYLKVSFQYQDRTDVNQSMYLLVVMENLRNYQYQLNVQ